MKRLIHIIAACIALSPLAATAQVYNSVPRPGVTISTSPGGTSVGVSGPYFNYVYTTDGYYDGYGVFHRTSHRHAHHTSHCKYCEKQMKKHHKEMQKRHKHEAKKHHHDNGKHRH